MSLRFVASRRKRKTGVRPAGTAWLLRTLTVAIALLVVGDAISLYVRQGPEPVSVDAALAQFRKTAPVSVGANQDDGAGAGGPNTSAPTGVGPAAKIGGVGPDPIGTGQVGPAATPGANATTAVRPLPGVYVYKTAGFEEVDVAGGARHDYPKESSVTIRNDGCGWSERWQPLKERWDETLVCAEPGATSARDFRSYHEFFKKAQEQRFTCPEGTHVARYDQQPGTRWTWFCLSGPSRFDTTTTYLGIESLAVGGRRVDAAHFRHDSVMTGANRGTQTQDRWVDPTTGLTLSVANDIDAEADSPFGTVKYKEHYSLDLTSLTPRT